MQSPAAATCVQAFFLSANKCPLALYNLSVVQEIVIKDQIILYFVSLFYHTSYVNEIIIAMFYSN